ncbi:MAG: lysine transporter LysE [Chitinophagales bacterium]|nr:MAG: lysine transporter LysE [Chitinophagales bacterium]
MVYLKGYGIGLAMIIFLGPVFFTLLKSSLQYGFKAGITVALGILASDVLCLMLCLFGAMPFFKNPVNQFWLGIAGTVILLALGLRYLLKPVLYDENRIALSSAGYSAFFAKGFLVNFVNPFVFVVWIGLITLARANYENLHEILFFLGGIVSGIFTGDIIKVLFSHKFKNIVQPALLTKIYRVIGLILIIFGLRMAWLVMTKKDGNDTHLKKETTGFMHKKMWAPIHHIIWTPE